MTTEIVTEKGVYVGLKPTKKALKTLGTYVSKYLPGVKTPSEFHLTLIMHEGAWEGNVELKNEKLQLEFGNPSLPWGPGTLVTRELTGGVIYRHNHLTNDYGFKFPFPEFSCHLSLSYEWDGKDIQELPPLGTLEFQGEYVEEYNPDWS